MKKFFPAFALLSFVLPFGANASVFISEVAWMGTAASANDEWIELTNDGSASADLSGWVLATEDGGIHASLSGALPAGGYFLLERTNDDTIPGVLADAIYTGSLSNNGETLVLKDASGAIVDRLDTIAGWPAGDNATKETMQKSAGTWLSAIATPQEANTVARSPLVESNNTLNEEEAGDGVISVLQISGSSGGESSGSKTSAGSVRVSAGYDVHVPVGVSVLFEGAVLSGTKNFTSPRFEWSFGDGTHGEGQSIQHTYEFPGEYIAVVAVRSGSAVYSDRASVKVFDPAIEMRIGKEKGKIFFEISNRSLNEINLAGFRLHSGEHKFIFPDHTFLAPKAILKISAAAIDFSLNEKDSVELLSQNGAVISQAADFASMAAALLSASEKVQEIKNKIAFLHTAQPMLSPSPSLPKKILAQASFSMNNGNNATPSSQVVVHPDVAVVIEPEGFFKRLYYFFFK